MNIKKEKKRSSKVTRQTKETNVSIELTVDGRGVANVSSGIPFFDHMLTLMAVHGFFDLSVAAQGDVEVDGHHTVEDIGLVFGQAIEQALGEKKGLRRYGHSIVPMDEALASVVVDISNRPFLKFNVFFPREHTGRFDTELVEEFFRAFVSTSRTTLHVNLIYGENTHHKIEAIFKAFGRALDEATKQDSRISDVLSTKGVL
jgi:imidazoleglycerol-phosphate dehydratase